MENALFLSSKRGDGATLAASSAETSLPVTYLQNPDPAAMWRATDCAAEWVTIDLGAPYACNALMLVGHSGSAAGTIRVRGAATAAGVTAAPMINTTALSLWPTSGKPTDEDWPAYLTLVRWNSATLRYWRFDIADGANPDGFFQAARVFIGKAVQLTYDVDLNVGLGLDSPDEPNRSPYGKTFIDPRGAASRRLVLPISNVNDRQMKDELFDLQRYCGRGRDFGFTLDPSATTDFHRYSLQAVFDGNAQFDAQPLFDSSGQVWRTSLTLNEMMP